MGSRTPRARSRHTEIQFAWILVIITKKPTLDGEDKLGEKMDSEVGRSGSEFIRYSLNEKLRGHMKAHTTRDSDASTGLTGGADGTQSNFNARGRHFVPFVNNVANDDGRFRGVRTG